MNKLTFPFLIPDLPAPALWLSRFESAFQTGIYSNFGPISRELEAKIAERYAHGSYSAIACCSATHGLVAALMSQFSLGQRIAVSNFTFAATYQAIRMAGLVPVPVDIDARTYEISIDSLEDTLSEKDIAGVMPVRPFGFVRDQNRLLAFCQFHNLPLVFDSAACLGNSILPKFGSEFGQIEVFSLHATKTFGIGEGGMVLCPSEQADRIRGHLNFGFTEDRRYGLGTNGKMDELHAAVGLAQLERIDDLQSFRETHAARYSEFFSGLEGVQIPADVLPGCAWTMYPVILSDQSATEIGAAAARVGIETRRYYWPTISSAVLHDIPEPVDLSVSEHISNHVVCFPIYGENGAHLVDRLFDALMAIFPCPSSNYSGLNI